MVEPLSTRRCSSAVRSSATYEQRQYSHLRSLMDQKFPKDHLPTLLVNGLLAGHTHNIEHKLSLSMPQEPNCTLPHIQNGSCEITCSQKALSNSRLLIIYSLHGGVNTIFEFSPL